MSLVGKAWPVACLCTGFAKDLVLSSIGVAKVVISRDAATQPGFVTVPLDAARTDLEISLIANYITLTPGTLSVDVSRDRRNLLVHCFVCDEGDAGMGAAVREDICDGIAPRVLRMTRA